MSSNPKSSLPIDSLLSQWLNEIRNHSLLLIAASTGSGKTTRLPAFLLQADPTRKKIAVLVPRRLAAQMAAERVAEENQFILGKEVGYRHRLESCLCDSTRLIYMTEGVLTRIMLQDPHLTEFSTVILDEFHERHLTADIALALTLNLQKTSRPDLKIILMSATLDLENLQQKLGPLKTLHLDLPVYPVQTQYLPAPDGYSLAEHVLAAIHGLTQAQSDPGGHILIFVPGWAEITSCQEKLTKYFGDHFTILPLHGELKRSEQQKIFTKTNQRKIILTTDIAESSLTIDGVRVVIDVGLKRLAVPSDFSGISHLVTRPASQSALQQRSGRAGRTAPGVCLRLFSDFDKRKSHETPEINRADLSQTLLSLIHLGWRDIENFPWFEKPSATHLQTALNTLRLIGAIDKNSAGYFLTKKGEKISWHPLHPRLGCLIEEGRERGITDEARKLADALSEDRPFSHWSPTLGQAALRAFPDRVARVLQNEEIAFCQGYTGKLPREAQKKSGELILVLSALQKRSPQKNTAVLHVQNFCDLEPEMLLDDSLSLLHEQEILEWKDSLGSVVCVKQLLYGELVLEESSCPPPDPILASSLFYKKVCKLDLDWQHPENLPRITEALKPFIDMDAVLTLAIRLHIFCKIKLGNSISIGEILQKSFSGIYSKADLKIENILAKILLHIDPKHQRELEISLPETIKLPYGRPVKIIYSAEQEPLIESRLQDFFGLNETPTLMDGKIKTTLRLLAPNFRPVQITSDLKGFWERHYPTLRQELKRRYPRHDWPENPLEKIVFKKKSR